MVKWCGKSSILSPGEHFVQQNLLSNFDRGPDEKHACNIISFGTENQELMSFNEFSIFSCSGLFVWWSKAVWAISDDCLVRKTSVIFFLK